jgi:hypothetical protein
LAETEQAAERLRQIPGAGTACDDGRNNRRLDHANCCYSRCLDGGFVATIKVYRDFELRLKFRLRGENVNAGVQFRSERVPGSNEMIGYQADMGQHYWGCLYDERRHRLLAGPTKEEQQKLIRPDDWNDYVIRAEGRHVQLWLNGRKTVDYTEPDATIPQEGVFGLQIHQGAPSEAWYKDIMIQVLPDKTQPQ